MEENERENEEQTAVANTNEEPSQAASEEQTGAAQEKGLEEILAEFDNASARQEETPARNEQTTPAPQLDVNAIATLEAQIKDIHARDARRELEGVFSNLADGLQADAVDAEAFLGAQALRNPKLNDLYANRNNNPKAWKDAFGALKQDFSKRFGKKVNKQVTESRDAVASAVRSASTAAPQDELTDKDVASMSKSDFDEMQRKFGVTPV